jgi:chemotaxis protein methyltransferase CheR
MTTSVTREELDLLSRYIHAICGVTLDASKGYLVESRLGGLLGPAGCSSYRDLHMKAKADPTKVLERKIIEAITTNETLFFRDAAPFELLRHKVLPDLLDRRPAAPGKKPGPIRIWSAACSTGQEVYSIAIVLKELLGDPFRYDLKVLGTDISDAVVAKASRGTYEKLEIERGLAPEVLRKHFVPAGGGWKVADEIRAMVSFRRLNLLEDFAFLGKFDVVFCRNVAIYFQEKDRTRLFDGIARTLEPDGSLIIGSTESLLGICSRFESKRYLRSVFYRPLPAGAVAAPAVVPLPTAKAGPAPPSPAPAALARLSAATARLNAALVTA